MAFDADLADRARTALAAANATTTEQKMFGGLAFMIGGNMCCGVMGEDLLVRVGPDAHETAMAEPAARPFEMGQRGPSAGFILVGPGGTDSEEDLTAWVSRALTFNATLPAKKAR